MPIPVLAYPQPELADDRVRLRPWREEDLDCVREASSDRDITDGTSVPDHFTEVTGLAFIHRQWARLTDGAGVSQAIVDTRTGVAAGLVIVSLRPQPDVAGLGYWVAPSARGAGLATAAVRLLAPWALRSLRLCRLEAWVAPDNLASQQVLRTAEFQLEGRLRNFLSTRDGATDALVYSQIPT